MSAFLDEFRNILARGEDLPTLPTVVAELNAALDHEMVGGNRIAAIIERDPPLATRLLRLANSAAFNTGRPVADVQTAIQMLGIRQVRALCVALSVMDAFANDKSGVIGPSFWKHSTGVANVARVLARCLDYKDISLDELYIGGLLHDVGLLILDQHFHKTLKRAVQVAESCDSPLWMAEGMVIATDHGEIGGLLLGSWSLPPSIVSMVSSHHNPKLAPEKFRDPCWLIATAEILCGGLGPTLDVERMSDARAQSILDAMRAADYDVDALQDEISEVTREMAA